MTPRHLRRAWRWWDDIDFMAGSQLVLGVAVVGGILSAIGGWFA